MRREYIPNIITVIRLMLISPIVITLLMREYRLAFILFFIAGLTDAVDGYLARRFHWISRFGSMIDPIADKFLLILTFLTLGYLQIIPVWLLLIVVLRDLMLVAGGITYHVLIGAYEFQPTLISKCNTFFQITLIILLMFEQTFHVLPLEYIHSLMVLVFLTSLISLVDYLVVWGIKAWQQVAQ